MTDDNVRQRIWAIPDGVPFKLDNMMIKTTSSNRLIVTGWTSTSNFENISRNTIRRELEELKSSYNDLSNKFKELNNIIANLGLVIEFHMAYDDAGKVGLGICSEVDGHLNWYID
jgi:hypothetical protein